MYPYNYFLNQENVSKKKYDSLRVFFFEKLPANEVANIYGYL